MSVANRILMLGLDAAECDLVLDLVGKDRMPTLARLLQDGAFGRLQTPADLYAGGVWPSFYTGTDVPSHGIFHNKLWRPETMRVDAPSEEWLAARPFWESIAEAGVPVCIVDVPMLIGQSSELNGVYLGGWGTHDLICKGSWPPTLWRDMQDRYGRPLMPPEAFGFQSPRSLMHLESALQRVTDQLCNICIDLLEEHEWRFACVVFGTLHRAGHYLWDLSQIDTPTTRANAEVDLDGALVRLYEQTDAALGRIVERLPAGTRIIVFAVHGMGLNPGWSDLLPDILSKLAAEGAGDASKRGLAYALKQAIPHHWVRPVLTRLPGAVNEHLLRIWSRGMLDWSATRYFSMPMDEAGYLRVNLAGREQLGIVPTSEYDAVCDELAALIGGIRDRRTGIPIAGEIVRAYRDAPADAARRRLVPDMIVPWNGPPARERTQLIADAQPGFVYDVPRRLPSGRSGNHTGNAWLLANGPGIPHGELDSRYSILDLAPTVLDWLGVEPRQLLQGKTIDFGALR
jgi:predicted AlkP superfamily phosphohydrolase/phosphomutase